MGARGVMKQQHVRSTRSTTQEFTSRTRSSALFASHNPPWTPPTVSWPRSKGQSDRVLAQSQVVVPVARQQGDPWGEGVCVRHKGEEEGISLARCARELQPWCEILQSAWRLKHCNFSTVLSHQFSVTYQQVLSTCTDPTFGDQNVLGRVNAQRQVVEVKENLFRGDVVAHAHEKGTLWALRAAPHWQMETDVATPEPCFHVWVFPHLGLGGGGASHRFATMFLLSLYTLL